MCMKIVVVETSSKATKLTLDSLLSVSDEIDPIDYDLPITTEELTDEQCNELPIYIISKTDTKISKTDTKYKFRTIGSIDELPDSQIIVMSGGYYSVNYKQLLEIKVERPTIFYTYPRKLNFYSENSYIVPSKQYIGKLIDLALIGELSISEQYIGIDNNSFRKYYSSPLLVAPRTAMVLNTPINYSFRYINQLKQLSSARTSIKRKFKNLKPALIAASSDDKVIKSYIRLLKSFYNSYSKYDYVFYSMFICPDRYEEIVNMSPFIPDLIDLNINETEETNLYTILVDYTLSPMH